MTINKRRGFAIAIALTLISSGIFGLWWMSVSQGGLVVGLNRYARSITGGNIAWVGITNLSKDSYELLCDPQDNTLVRCSFRQSTSDGTTNWMDHVPRVTKTVKMLEPGEIFYAQIPLPTNGLPVEATLVTRRIPKLNPPKTMPIARVQLELLRLKFRFLGPVYEEYEVPGPLFRPLSMPLRNGTNE